MTTIFAIDPGSTESGWLFCESSPFRILDCGITENAALLTALEVHRISHDVDTLLIEKVESFGMAVGFETFETVFWSGRFAQVAQPIHVERIGRKAIKINLCGTARATQANLRQAVLDRFGGKAVAIGAKKTPGPLYSVRSHVWSALFLALTYLSAMESRPAVGAPAWEEMHDALKAQP